MLHQGEMHVLYCLVTKKRMDGEMSHIESFRLFELAEMPAIIDEPEWKHIENCKTCGLVFVQFKVIIADPVEFSLNFS